MVDECKRQVYWPCRERGVALAMLMWLLAAMTMLVASIGYQAKTDIKLTQLQVAEAKARALGDGAMRLMLAEVFASESEDSQAYEGLTLLSRSYDFNGTDVRVDIVPLDGDWLVNILEGSRDQLQNIFEIDGVLSGEIAVDLADEVISRREGPKGDAILTIEDLMLLKGMSRAAFEVLRESVFVKSQGGFGSYRIDAYIQEGEFNFLRRRWVSVGAQGLANLPWRYFRTESIRVVSQIDG